MNKTRPLRRIPLLSKFFLIIFVVLVIPTLLMTLFSNIRVQELWWTRLEESLRFGTNSFIGRLNLELKNLEAMAGNLARDPGLLNFIRESKKGPPPLENPYAFLDAYTDLGILLFGSDGKPVRLLGKPSVVDPDSEKFGNVLPEGGLESKILVSDRGIGLLVILGVQELSQRAGSLVFVKEIDRAGIESLRLSIGQELSIIDKTRGIQLYSTITNAYGELTGNGKTYGNPVVDNLMIEEVYEGKPYYSLYSPLPKTSDRLFVKISIAKNAVLAVDTAQTLVAVMLSTMLLVALSSLLLTRTVISPILTLSYAVESMKRHLRDFGPLVTIPVPRNDEVGDLAVAVNELAHELRQSSEKIEEQQAQITAYTQSLEQRVRDRTKEMEEARIRAEIANNHKSKFLVNMNHELRTPLNSIAGTTDLLRFGAYEKNEEIAEELQRVLENLGKRKIPKKNAAAVEQFRERLDLFQRSVRADGNTTKLVLRYFLGELKALDEAQTEDTEALERALAMAEEEERHIFQAYNTIRDAGDSLLNIIDEVINLSRIESGVIEIKPEPVRLADVVNSCMVHAESYARTKRKYHQLEFHKRIESEVPEWLLLDQQKVKQVVLNLLTNAVKYTEKGFIHLRISVSNADGKRLLRFSVQDTGRGIAEKDKKLLFLEFGRSFEVREIEGTGLGLALSRRIVERHGGAIGFSSEEGSGSTFWFTLPLHEAKGSVGAQSSSQIQEPGKNLS